MSARELDRIGVMARVESGEFEGGVMVDVNAGVFVRCNGRIPRFILSSREISSLIRRERKVWFYPPMERFEISSGINMHVSSDG